MKTRWKWLIIGYLLTLAITSIWLAYNAMFESSYELLSFQDRIFLFIYYALPLPNFFHVISMSIGCYLGWKKENKENTLRLPKLKRKIRAWKKEGYNVKELEEKLKSIEE